MRPDRTRTRSVFLPAFLSVALVFDFAASAQPKFSTSQILGRSSEIMVGDLDGDGLQDLVLVNSTNLSVYFQDRAQGFTRDAQQIIHLDNRPCLVWTAKVGRPAESLLVMDCDGVTQWDFTNRNGPPVSRVIIRQKTIVPDAPDYSRAESNAIAVTMSVATREGWPLLLVPTAEGIQVWQHRQDWAQAQFIGNAVTALERPSPAVAGYNTVLGLDFSVADVNGDGRDDLIVRRNQSERTNIYSIYLQQTNGLFGAAPVLTYADKVEPYSWLCWTDLNHDGKVDLIRTLWLNDPSFIPGQPSGKVLVGIYPADARGRIPKEPQQAFRKNDWTPALPIVDVDGDGYADLVLGYSQMDTREGVRKEITAKQLDYTLRFFFYRPGAGFPKEADCTRDVVIHLDTSQLLLSYGRSQYFARCVKLDGDFNGDGKADLLVRDQSDDISAYFFISREKGFSAKPDLRFSCPGMVESWQAKDLNGDGVSDLIVRLANLEGYRVFISQK